jgi:tetratricopeptide (TPR) repeat protein
MFRRRPVGPLRPRRFGRLMRPGPTVPEPVRRAMRLWEEGRYSEAAGAFDHLSQGAEERGQLFQAANLSAQAARCYLILEDVDAAYEKGLRALDLFKRAGRPGAARRLVEKMIGVLREKSREGEVQALERELSQLPSPVGSDGHRGELPGKCEQCGGPIKESETTWIGPSSAKCPYCGSVVKAE